MDETYWRDRLEARLAELLAGGERGAGSETVELDQSRVGRLSRMDALQGQAMSRASDARRRAELGRVRAALARLDDGEFGSCADCDEPIAPARLEIDPAAERCIGCASRREED